MMQMKLKLKQNLQSNGSRLEFNLEKLKDPEVADLFEVAFGGRFAALNLLEENLDNLTENTMENSSALHLKYLAKSGRKRTTFWIYVT